jgi:hypothetical protein
MNSELNGRRVHHWRGQDPKADIAALADAIGSIEGLCNFNGGIALLDGNGGLSPINFAGFCDLLDRHICEARVVNRDGTWRMEYRPFKFDPAARYGGGGPRPPPDQSQPDSATLDQLYRHEILVRIPKVES